MNDPAPAPARVLVLNAASARLGARFGLLEHRVLRHEGLSEGQGAANGLAPLLDHGIRTLGWRASSLDVIAVVVGPGSFTGLRASLALAHGLALGSGAAVVGVTVGEALAPALRKLADGDAVWCASQARRGRVFIERPDLDDAPVSAAMLDALPPCDDPVLVAGDAEAAVADALLHRGDRVRRAGIAAPSMLEIADAVARRLSGALPPRPAQPLYVDAPEARSPMTQPAA